MSASSICARRSIAPVSHAQRYAVCSAITAMLTTSSQKKLRANSQTPNTSRSQIAPVTMIA
jgi:hypothetical protein